MLKKLILPLLLTVFVIGCASSSEDSSAINYLGDASDSPGMAMPQSAPMDDMEMDYDQAEEKVDVEVARLMDSTAESLSNQNEKRVIIQNGDLGVVVKDPEAAAREIARRAESLGGWVVESSVYSYSDTQKQARITVRIPAAQLMQVTDEIKADSIDIMYENISGRDVTDEFVDLSSQLESLQATEARVKTFLDEARNVKDALAVNSELEELQREIAVITGRVNYLSESATYSSLSIDLTPHVENRPIDIPTWNPQGTAGRAVERLVSLGQGFINMLIWFAIVWVPILLVLGAIAWLARFAWQRVARTRLKSRPVFRRNHEQTHEDIDHEIDEADEV